MTDSLSTRASLLVRLRDPRDQAAWGEFVELYTPLVYGYARKQGLQDADAADVTQDVFSALTAALGRLEYDPGRGTFRSWLFTLVRRRLGKWRAAQSAPSAQRLRGSGDTATRDLLEQCPAPKEIDAQWEEEWQKRLFTWACQQVQKEVRAATWQAFWRTAVDGQACKQAAAELGLSVTAVYIARCRILDRLRELIQSVQEP
jgi:RNA polymerase sigma-70 factor (ECF subfamily)